ncbi:MAG TPA: penicillin-binding transpeptidase domain-containing protein [Acidimicrobiales bacterium]|nr:penicillin-binding transpeptidase domain-containing protein [Acidimicrobiales bacterium]
MAGVAVAVAVALLAGHRPSSPGPAVDAYLAAWSKQDWPAMQALVHQVPPDFVAAHEGMVKDLEVVSLRYQPGVISRHGATAEAAYTAHLVLRGLGTWDYAGTLHVRSVSGSWRVEWTPATLHPALPPGGHFARDRTWPARAHVLGSGGTPLTGLVSSVSIGVQGSRVKDPAPVTAALVQSGADPAKVAAALAQAKAQPDQFVAVFDVSDDRYQQLRPALFPVPGVVFVRHSDERTLTPDLAAHVVGTVGPVTADQLKALGEPYEAGDLAGQGDLEAIFERQLAGTPSGDVKIVDGRGQTIATVTTFTGHPGTSVSTTLDLRSQQAAEHALDGVSQPAALVALRASTGEVLAVVSRPTATPFDRALNGLYPPGSTFKVITSAALLAAGLTPDSPASCPATLTVGGRTFHNFEGEVVPSLPLHRAFAASCNTAFIGLAARLSPQALVTTAGQFGFGTTPQMGLPAVGGQVPVPTDDVAKAATAIGQAQVEASPLRMATVAASVDSGVVHAPRLVSGAPDDTAPAQPLDATVVSGLQQMMAEVVSSGTGTAAAIRGGPPVSGKTGTAEYGNANPPTTHAWFIGYRGDVAFAVVVEGGGIGGQVAAPVAARFLAGL